MLLWDEGGGGNGGSGTGGDEADDGEPSTGALAAALPTER
jgi:hypothetical protein